MIKKFTAILFLSLLPYIFAIAEDAKLDPEQKKLQRITVVGDSENEVPGSADLIKGEALENAKGAVDDIDRVLRRVPGVNIVEEDGFGIRPNIGMRGVSSERSANITLMEDGILAAPAPYSAPAAYFFPSTGRMEGIEILKGAGQIKYGPRTTGGSLNLLSSSIPRDDKPKINFNAKGGSFESIFGHFNAGQSVENFGWLLETYQADSHGFKDLDGGGDTGFGIQDYLGKFRINSTKSADLYQELELKLGTYDNQSNETYLGLTEDDFNKTPNRRYSASQIDRLDVDNSQMSLRHYAELSEDVDLTTTSYYNKTQRSWNKIESVGGKTLSNILDNPYENTTEMDWIKGSTSPDDSLVLRDADRGYGSRGIQSVLAYQFETPGLEHDLELGARYHYDYENRIQQEDKYRMQDGVMHRTTQGTRGGQTNRKTEAGALALHAQDKINYKKLTVTPGLRYENINLKYSDYGKNDLARNGNELTRNYSDVQVVIPGVGTQYHWTKEFSSILGVHKGFAPPGPSKDDGAKEEESVNYETGIAYNKDALNSDLTFFYNDYSNLLGADTLSGGGEGTGDLFNAGESSVYGVETSVKYDFDEFLNTGYGLPIYANYTYTDAQFDENFNSSFFGLVESGDAIPYIARNQAAAGTGIEFAKTAFYLNMFYVDAMPTAAGAEGLQGGPKTDSHVIFDLTTDYKLNEDTKLYFVVENLFDEDYVAAIRPAGARPGRPLTFMAGFKFTL